MGASGRASLQKIGAKMSWVLSLILFVVTHAPELYSLVKQIIDLIRQLPKADREEAKKQISEAVKSQDVNQVKETLNHWHKRCEGVACPMDTLGES